MFFIQTHSTPTFDPVPQIKKNLLLHKHLINKFKCDFFVFHEGIDNIPKNVNFFEQNGIDSTKINFCVTGTHEPRRNHIKENGDLISIQPGSIKAVTKAMEIAMRYGYDQAAYFDHDIQFFSDKIEQEFFGLNVGSGANMSYHYGFPETAFWIINKDVFDKIHSIFSKHLTRSDKDIVDKSMIMEYMLQLTHTFNFKGDRFGDWGLPESFNHTYDYVAQLPPNIYYTKKFNAWWKTTITTELDNLWF